MRSPGRGDIGAPQSHSNPKPAATTVIILSSSGSGRGKFGPAVRCLAGPRSGRHGRSERGRRSL